MFQTATVTDLRFKTNKVLNDTKGGMVWILKNGKKVGVLLDVRLGDEFAEWKNHSDSGKSMPALDPARSILENAKKYQISGPGDMSTTIDETLYG
jgi:hypothetical protein